MKSVGELFKELGFKKDSSLETQKAFIKYLISAANASTQTPAALPQVNSKEKELPSKGAQLEFDFSEKLRVS